MARMTELAKNHVPFYSRLQTDNEGLRSAHQQPQPLLHNLDIRKLRRRCCFSITAVLVIAFALWIFDPPAGHETEPDITNTNTQLKFVTLVHRHGARSALHHYTFEKGIKWDVPSGKLLNVGFKNGFKAGQKLREMYSSGAGSLTTKNVIAYSTNIDRTIDTVYSVLIGLFTPNTTKVEKSNCTCRPDDFSHSEPQCIAQCIGVPRPKVLPKVEYGKKDSKTDKILRQYELCKGWDAFKEKVYKSDIFKKPENPKFQEKIKQTKQWIGEDFVYEVSNNKTRLDIDLEILSHIWDTKKCLEAQDGSNNGPYDNFTEIVHDLEDVATYVWHHLYSTKFGPNLGGLLLNEIINALKKGANRPPITAQEPNRFINPKEQGSNPLMVIYSAHDSTLASLMAAMNYGEWHFPYFLSHIIFELYGPKDPSDTKLESHYIRVLYTNKDSDYEPLKLGNCKYTFCTINDFLEPLKDRTRTVEDCDPVNTD